MFKSVGEYLRFVLGTGRNIPDPVFVGLVAFLVCGILKSGQFTPVLDTLTTIADKRPNKTTEQHHAIVQSKLIRLQHAAHKKRE